MDIILASTSPYRRRLLERLQLSFRCIPPEIEEISVSGEMPAAMAQRLALLKAQSVAERYPDAVVIGCDQVAFIEGSILGKPGRFIAPRQKRRALCPGRGRRGLGAKAVQGS